MSRNAAIALAFLMVVLLFAATGAFFLFRGRKKTSKSENGLLIVPRPTGGYAIRPANESFAGAKRKERMTEPSTNDEVVQYIDTSVSYIDQVEQGRDMTQNCDTCRRVSSKNNEDMLWLMNLIRREVEEASKEALRDRSTFVRDAFEMFRVVNEDPVTIRVTSEEGEIYEYRVGVDPSTTFFQDYIIVLLAYKGADKPLPRPDPALDYTQYHDR